MPRMPTPPRWDIFCRVVDNYGDAGVAWRLARILAREHGKRVRLLLDDVTVLSRLLPQVNAMADSQALQGVTILRWNEGPWSADDIADVVVETFGCDPPTQYVLAMIARQPRARWINLEYLSAEDWVEGSHKLPSPHPMLPLVKHYFFPGFTARTGGLLREGDLLARRDAFRADAAVQANFWRTLVGEVPSPETLKVSLFAYPGAPVDAWFAALAQVNQPVWVVAPGAWPRTSAGNVRFLPVPFLSQDRYDELLWACDVNFVRGEDSFVRAQWAARPFVWHIYPQEEGAHFVKLQAFLARYTKGLERGDAALLTALWESWNRGEPVQASWGSFVARRQALEAHARAWCDRLATRPDLAATLADFADNVLK
jgi:uncharacterized repeat protein (TIGR03837 family)